MRRWEKEESNAEGGKKGEGGKVGRCEGGRRNEPIAEVGKRIRAED